MPPHRTRREGCRKPGASRRASGCAASTDPTPLCCTPAPPSPVGQTELIEVFTRPRRVALVGASTSPESLTHRPALFLSQWGFPGEVVVVNPKGVPTMLGFPAVASIAEAGPFDLAMVLLAADQVPQALQACIAAGARGAIVIASGFEGDHGRARRAGLASLLQEHPGFRLVGPNCNGVLSIQNRCTLSFSSVLLNDRPPAGRVGLVTQSGAIGNGIMLALGRRGVGLAHWFSTGDELDVGALEAATAMLDEEQCGAVGLFLEGITDPEFLEPLAEGIARTGKRVVALRTAASEAGRAAAFGHTGRVIGNAEIARAALRQAGVRLPADLDEFCDALTVLSGLEPRWTTERVRVGVVTVSGGVGVLAADEVEQSADLELAVLSDATRAALAARLPGISPANPLDVPTLGSPQVIVTALQAMAAAEEVDVVVGVVTSIAHDYDLIADTDLAGGKPMVLSHLSVEERFTPEQAARLTARGVVTVPEAARAVKALAIWAGPGRAGAAKAVQAKTALRPHTFGLTGSALLLGPALTRNLAPATPVADAAGAVAAAAGAPVVVKADGAVITHRTEAGAVVVDVASPETVTAAFNRVAAACAPVGEAVVVQPMAPEGLEVMLSIVRDPEVGVAVLLREGGTGVELARETVVLTGPRATWEDTLRPTPLGRLLAGWRGAPPADTAGLLDLAAALMDVVRSRPEIALVECNPVLVHPAPGGVTVVDVFTAVDPAP